MAKIVFSNWTPSMGPAWVGDIVDRSTNLAGGVMLNASQFTADSDGHKFVASGTLLGRTYTERDAGTGFGPAVLPDPEAEPPVAGDDEIYLLLYDVADAADSAEAAVYRHGALVKENYLPTASKTAEALAVVRSLYDTTIGTV